MYRVCFRKLTGNLRGGFFFPSIKVAEATMSRWGFKRDSYVILKESR